MLQINVDKQVAYWLSSAGEDWTIAAKLIRENAPRHGLFFMHLAVEKAVKAHVCKVSRKTPPKLHDLLALARLGNVALSAEQRDLLAVVNTFCLEGRYEEHVAVPPSTQEARQILAKTQEVYEWLRRTL